MIFIPSNFNLEAFISCNYTFVYEFDVKKLTPQVNALHRGAGS